MPVSESNKRAIKKYYKNNYDKTEVPKGTTALIKKHFEAVGEKGSVVQFIGKAVKNLIEAEDEMYGVTTDMSGYMEKKKPQSEEPLYYSVTSNPNELQSVGGTKYLPTAMRMAKALGKEYVIVAYNDVSGVREYILKMNEKGDWVKTNEFDV